MMRQSMIAANVLFTLALGPLACGLAPTATSSICIEHAGDSDKPVPQIQSANLKLGLNRVAKIVWREWDR